MTILAHEKPVYELENALHELQMKAEKAPLEWKNELAQMEKKLQELKDATYSNLSAWERVTICRHPKRPHSSDYIKAFVDDFVEIFGDRTFKDDEAIITGFGTIQGEKFLIVGQEKGHDTEERMKRNFGMPHPEGYRKAMRAMRLAEKFNLPVLCLLDTPGAYPGLAAEERGQGWAISQNLFEMSRLKTQIIVLVIGEGCSGGALGIGVGDSIAMLEHSYYSVISPEGCASILWKDASKNSQAASILKMHAEHLLELEVIDDVIHEPKGGAHHSHETVFENVKTYILSKLEELKKMKLDDLLENRYQKFRKMGKFVTKTGLAQHETSTSGSATK